MKKECKAELENGRRCSAKKAPLSSFSFPIDDEDRGNSFFISGIKGPSGWGRERAIENARKRERERAQKMKPPFFVAAFAIVSPPRPRKEFNQGEGGILAIPPSLAISWMQPMWCRWVVRRGNFISEQYFGLQCCRHISILQRWKRYMMIILTQLCKTTKPWKMGINKRSIHSSL